MPEAGGNSVVVVVAPRPVTGMIVVTSRGHTARTAASNTSMERPSPMRLVTMAADASNRNKTDQ
jgi:hypothetical protein